MTGCGKSNTDVDMTGAGDSPRRDTASDAGGAVRTPNDDGPRRDDARADGGKGKGAGGRTIDDSEPAPTAPTSGSPPATDRAGVGEATWDPEACHVPSLEPPADPSGEMRWALAREYCETIEAQGCLGSAIQFWYAVDDCSDEELLRACQYLVLEVHSSSIATECENLWSAAIACAAQSFGEGCLNHGFDYPYGTMGACPEENDALLVCQADYPAWNEVEGTYTTCLYGPGTTSACEVLCPVGENHATLDCSGPDDVPLRCGCAFNGVPLNEGSVVAGMPDPIWVDDCEDAARQAADGMCTSRLDCCFEYFDGRNDLCTCGAIPERAGFDSCEALAESVMGRTVAICPQYERSPSTCWPPPCD